MALEANLKHHELMMLGMGAAFGTAKAGIGIAGIGTYRPDLIMKVGKKWRIFDVESANDCSP